MARRKSHDPSDSMDSLMDALTNVVAVLIVILLLLQVDVENTVNKMFDNLKPATPEQIELAKTELKVVQDDIKAQEDLLAAPAPTGMQISQIRTDLSLLEKSIADQKAKLIALADLQKLAEKTEKDAAAEKLKTDERLATIQQLEALLDQTPRPKPQEASIVNIPESRPIPNNANIYYCVITGDQAHFVDVIDAQKKVMDLFDAKKKDFAVERIRDRGEKTRYIYQQDEVVKFFESQVIKNRNQTITVPYNKPWTRLSVRVNFDPKVGDASLADMQQPNGRFHRVIDLVKSYPRSVLIFKVHPTGFATYLKARQIADEQQVPSGWEVDGNPFVSAPLEIEVNRLEQPPAPPTTPPPPKRKLD